MPPQKRLFQVKMYLALEKLRTYGFEEAISWMPHGRAFKILDKKKFQEQILGPYLNMREYPSFVRQCNLYGFRRLTNASGRLSSGASYNECFLRGRPDLLRRMTREKKKGTLIRP